MKRILFILLIPTLALGQTFSLTKADFDNLEIYKNEYHCLIGWNGLDFFGRGTTEISLFSTVNYEDEINDTYLSYKNLNVVVDKFKINKSTNKIDLSGYVSGGWYDAKSKIMIYIGSPTKQTDTIYLSASGRPTYVDGKKIDKPYPIDVYENLIINVKNSFQTSDGIKDENENRAFNISFCFDKNDLLVFGLSSFIPEIFELGKLLEE
jgi:hypothetical protein